MQTAINNINRFPGPRHVVVLLAAMTLYRTPMAADVPPPPPNLEQQGLPSIREDAIKQQKKSARPENMPPKADQALPSAIKHVEIHQPTPLLSKEIEALLNRFLGKDHLSGQALEQVRGQIWDFYRDNGRLARVELTAIPRTDAEGGSILQARIYEISVRSVRVEQEEGSPLKQSLLDNILASTKDDIAEGGVLNLGRLDSRLKKRLFLSDVNVRATLVPIDSEHVDVKVLVSPATPKPLGLLAQYDNTGLRAYGRSRYIVGLSVPGRLLPGDDLEILGLTSSGMNYGQISYEFPLVSLGARMNVLGSTVDYRVPSVSSGKATTLGTGLSYPLYIGNNASWFGALNYVNRHEVDKLANGTPTANKKINKAQGKLSTSYSLSASQSLYANATLTLGDLDLSSLKSAQEQDSTSAKTSGHFTKLEWVAGWSSLFGPSGKYDSRLEVRGQQSNKNLDQSEKFMLGGPLGVSAYGPAEAPGDEGYITNAELGYRLSDRLRLLGFYDIGRIRQYKNSWGVQSTPKEYTLQSAGTGFTYTYKSVVGSATYSRQIGSNPGLFSTGLDSDGLNDRYRLWFSLAWRM